MVENIWYMVYSVRYINIRILQNMISGSPLIWGLGTRMSDPYVYVVLWAPSTGFHTPRFSGLLLRL